MLSTISESVTWLWLIFLTVKKFDSEADNPISTVCTSFCCSCINKSIWVHVYVGEYWAKDHFLKYCIPPEEYTLLTKRSCVLFVMPFSVDVTVCTLSHDLLWAWTYGHISLHCCGHGTTQFLYFGPMHNVSLLPPLSPLSSPSPTLMPISSGPGSALQWCSCGCPCPRAYAICIPWTGE